MPDKSLHSIAVTWLTLKWGSSCSPVRYSSFSFLCLTSSLQVFIPPISLLVSSCYSWSALCASEGDLNVWRAATAWQQERACPSQHCAQPTFAINQCRKPNQTGHEHECLAQYTHIYPSTSTTSDNTWVVCTGWCFLPPSNQIHFFSKVTLKLRVPQNSKLPNWRSKYNPLLSYISQWARAMVWLAKSNGYIS